MTIHLHHLTGCAPTPLAFYLKALGTLRIVGEQKDRDTRGWWQDEHFFLLTQLDRTELERFFLEEYSPTPFISPWNKGSGFYGVKDAALAELESSQGLRFKAFRTGIAEARKQLTAISDADAAVRVLKSKTKKKKGMTPTQADAARALKQDPDFKKDLAEADRRFKQLKADLFSPCLRSWRGPHRAWMDAAVVQRDSGKLAWPSLLGTGGNDGNLDFTNNAMQRLTELFDLASADGHPKSRAAELLAQALWGHPSDKLDSGAAIGQFFPSGAGGANSANGAEGESLVNPWDFVLMLEGSVLFSSRATRRLDPSSMSRASAPFAVRSHPVGHGSKGREKDERGEQWMPLWSQPTSTTELCTLLGEARIQLGKQLADRPIDVARAIARIGIARGIDGFTRFGYLERNGQAKIAVPLGRVNVHAKARSRLIDDLAPWLGRLQRASRGDGATGRLSGAESVLGDAVFASLTHDDSPDRWQAVLLAAVGVEAIQASGTAFEAGPMPKLSPDWVAAADDGSPEFRLARALGSGAASYFRGRPRDPLRHHWLPLREGGRRFLTQERRLLRDTRVVMFGREPTSDLSALVERRLIEATQSGERRLPIVAARGCSAHPADLAQAITGAVDLSRVSALARAFMAVRWDRWQPPCREPLVKGEWPDEAWMALRLAHLAWPLAEGRSIPVDESVIRRLIAGDAGAAVETALRRLRSGGLLPPLSGACADPATARLWAAALAFPISGACAQSMALYFERTTQKENR